MVRNEFSLVFISLYSVLFLLHSVKSNRREHADAGMFRESPEDSLFLRELRAFLWDLLGETLMLCNDVPSGFLKTRKSVCAQGVVACFACF